MLKYLKCNIDDIDILVEKRIEVLRAANHLSEDVDMSVVIEQSYNYYKQAIPLEMCSVYFVYDTDNFVACGGISYYDVMPTFNNSYGKNGYIMNMYTVPAYRKCGIATNLLEILTKEAMNKGISRVTLEATEMGRDLYIKFGFKELNNEMECYLNNSLF